jgi:hypothetical protein
MCGGKHICSQKVQPHGKEKENGKCGGGARSHARSPTKEFGVF